MAVAGDSGGPVASPLVEPGVPDAKGARTASTHQDAIGSLMSGAFDAGRFSLQIEQRALTVALLIDAIYQASRLRNGEEFVNKGALNIGRGSKGFTCHIALLRRRLL